MAKKTDNPLNEANARALVELLMDSDTTDTVAMNIINHLLASQKGQTWFKTVMEEKLSYGACPKCNHENHWVIPEDELNKMGWVTHEKDSRVVDQTNIENCSEYREACKKKKVVVF